MSRQQNKNTFDPTKHYIDLYSKLKRLLKDFNIEHYINFKNVTKLNNCLECHTQISEPKSHEQAKKKLFNCFVFEKNYLVESELKANKPLFVPNKGERNYQFDVFVVDIPKFLTFMEIMKDYFEIKTELDFNVLKLLEQGMIFAVEADGGGHSEAKDAVRDRFFFRNYNIITVRYPVNQLVRMEESEKMKKTRLKYNIYVEYSDTPLLFNITCENIVSDAKTKYKEKYSHI